MPIATPILNLGAKDSYEAEVLAILESDSSNAISLVSLSAMGPQKFRST